MTSIAKRLADCPGQALGATGAGQDAEVDLRLAELRGFRRDDDVARHRELAAAAEAIARDGRDERRAQRANRVPAVDAAALVQIDRRRRRELADVGTGREHSLAAAEHDAADRVVFVELLQRADDLVHQLRGQRVERLRPVHQHDADGSVALDDDEAHLSRSRNLRTAPCASSPSIDIASQSRACVAV